MASSRPHPSVISHQVTSLLHRHSSLNRNTMDTLHVQLRLDADKVNEKLKPMFAQTLGEIEELQNKVMCMWIHSGSKSVEQQKDVEHLRASIFKIKEKASASIVIANGLFASLIPSMQCLYNLHMSSVNMDQICDGPRHMLAGPACSIPVFEDCDLRLLYEGLAHNYAHSPSPKPPEVWNAFKTQGMSRLLVFVWQWAAKTGFPHDSSDIDAFACLQRNQPLRELSLKSLEDGNFTDPAIIDRLTYWTGEEILEDCYSVEVYMTLLLGKACGERKVFLLDECLSIRQMSARFIKLVQAEDLDGYDRCSDEE